MFMKNVCSIFRSKTRHLFIGTGKRFFVLTFATIVGISSAGVLLTNSFDNLTLCASENENVLDTTKLADELRTNMQSIRNKLKKDSLQTPPISVRLLKYDGCNGKPVETQVLELTFIPTSNVDVCGLVEHWLSVVNPHSSHQLLNIDHVRKVAEFYSNANATGLPVVSENKSCSLTLMKSVSPVRGTNKLGFQVSVSLFKDNGFTRSDVDKIVKGYSEAFSSRSATNTKTGVKLTQFAFVPDTNSNANVNDGGSRVVIEGKGNIPGLFTSPEFDGWLRGDSGLLSNGLGSQRDVTFTPDSEAVERTTKVSEEKNTGSMSSGDSERVVAAVRALEKLGVEVFDRTANATLTWDSLAGYSHVKKHIQDTIVNALQHPDIYDAVASRTRVVFESNRPKAVLLEGPPGTGKTLTARILASQCERPLIVIRLESVVSKWFGDSEKKLSQIFDACDALDGAIIFVDEIDSLAQSRDSEGGIHEVSKRILSVLLQRIEGFHGKGRSVLVCATNRKQDLDSALVSRFDLIIPYALPDYSTRYEILRRYAKQFESSARGGDAVPDSKDSFSVLSEAMAGLSCRAIKEVCEQAERLCASRLVTEHKETQLAADAKNKPGLPFFSFGSGAGRSTKLSDVPSLDDYLLCIKHRAVSEKPHVKG